MAHQIGVSNHCTAITGGLIVVIVAPRTATKSMSPTTVLLEPMTEPMLPNRCLQSMIIFFFDSTVIIFIIISTSYNFEIQTVNSYLTLNPTVNSNLKVIFF